MLANKGMGLGGIQMGLGLMGPTGPLGHGGLMGQGPMPGVLGPMSGAGPGPGMMGMDVNLTG